MKALKTMVIICIVACMSTGCRHDHSHDEKSKTEQSGHSHSKDDKEHKSHRH